MKRGRISAFCRWPKGYPHNTVEVIVSYVECERCGWKGCHVEENRGQGVISNR